MPRTRSGSVCVWVWRCGREAHSALVYSFAKSVDLTSVSSNLETRIPIDVRAIASALPRHTDAGQMSIEAVVAFILLVLGCAMTSKQLRGISWSDNMRE